MTKTNEHMSSQDQQILLRLARNAIQAHIDLRAADVSEADHLSENQGVFVTLHKGGRLRGCIGYPEPVLPLNTAVVEAARAAAFEDPRFPPVNINELPQLHIEISVLTVPEKLEAGSRDDYPDKLVIGRDGLIIRGPHRSGLLLPQVATEQGFSPLEFLECVCHKAGLHPDAWRDEENSIYTFQAIIFSEDK